MVWTGGFLFYSMEYNLLLSLFIYLFLNIYLFKGFPCSSVGKKSACNAGDLGSIPGLGRSPGEGNGNPLQYSCLENPMDRGAWQATGYKFIYLAALGLSWSTQNLCCIMWELSLRHTGSLVSGWEFSCSMAYGILVPRPRIKFESPVLQGRSLTNGRAGRSLLFFILMLRFSQIWAPSKLTPVSLYYIPSVYKHFLTFW